MKQKVINFANQQYQEIVDNKTLSAQQQVYQSSMPLLALATLDNSGANKILENMENILKSNEIEKNCRLWMIGRMLFAAKLLENSNKLTQYQNQLSKQIAIDGGQDAITGWAYAYLALANHQSYLVNQQKLRNYSEFARDSYQTNPKNASNYLWTLTMNVLAAASANNKEDYQYYLTSLKALSPNDGSLKEAVSLVPQDDYRQWFISVLRYSFTLMHDEDPLQELPPITSQEVNSMDDMLAWANELKQKPVNRYSVNTIFNNLSNTSVTNNAQRNINTP